MALILTRKFGQSILIGENVRVTVFSKTHGGATGQVKVAIEAPPEVPIVREELRRPSTQETSG